MEYQRPSALHALWRAATMRCPRCGGRGLFRTWVTMVDECPRCSLEFERTEGYWLGSMVINLAATMGAFLVVFLGTIAITWPDVPWTGLTIAVVLVSALTPIVFHPFARLLWVALERQVRSRTEPYA